ncbi:D-lactate ferricytochrome c oxidoreductase, partial [Coemansia spiralis]
MDAASLNAVSAEDVAHFAGLGIKVEDAGAGQLGARYNTDMLEHYTGDASVALLPASTEQVSQILAYCNERRIGVVVQGGNTGVPGGAVGRRGEVVLSLAAMNTVRNVDPVAGVLVADAGCVLADLDAHVQVFGFIVPLDLGSRERCMIGGNVSTSAGGLRYLRYGSMHGNVLGVEAVLPDGRILDALVTTKKDASGYDVKQLFIGAEGTLGVVTAVALALAPKPQSTQVVVLGVSDFGKIHRAFVVARQALGEIVSAFEFWERRCDELVVEFMRYPSPLGAAHEYSILVETRGSVARHDAEKMEAFLDALRAEGLVDEARVLCTPEAVDAVWRFRSDMAAAHARSGCMHVYDFSLPPQHQAELLSATKRHLESLGLYGTTDSLVKDVTIFGHIGDDNIHLQIVARKFDRAIEEYVEPWLYEWVGSHRGSIAAEHGLGAHKAQFLHQSKSPVVIDTMKSLKQLLDPRGIMGPGRHISMARHSPYAKFVVNNASQVSSIENALRILTYVLPGRFADAELASEAIYTLLSFVGVYHDSLLARAATAGLLVDKLGQPVKVDPTPFNRYHGRLAQRSDLYRTASLLLGGLQFGEKLIEMLAVKKLGEKRRWRVVVWIEIAK